MARYISADPHKPVTATSNIDLFYRTRKDVRAEVGTVCLSGGNIEFNRRNRRETRTPKALSYAASSRE